MALIGRAVLRRKDRCLLFTDNVGDFPLLDAMFFVSNDVTSYELLHSSDALHFFFCLPFDFLHPRYSLRQTAAES